MFNIFSIKELLHKSSESQWNITGTLPGKLKRKISWTLSYKILPPEITKTWEIAILGVTLGTWEPMWNSMVFYDFVNFWESFSLYLLVKNSLNFKLVFFSHILNIFQAVSSGKMFYIEITIVPGDIDAKKIRKTLPKLQIKFFLNA